MKVRKEKIIWLFYKTYMSVVFAHHKITFGIIKTNIQFRFVSITKADYFESAIS